MNTDTGEITRLSKDQMDKMTAKEGNRMVPITEQEAAYLGEYEPLRRPSELLLNRAGRRREAAIARKANARR